MFTQAVKSANGDTNNLITDNKTSVNKKCTGKTAASCDGPAIAGGCSLM